MIKLAELDPMWELADLRFLVMLVGIADKVFAIAMRIEHSVLVLGLPAFLPKLIVEQVLEHEPKTLVYAVVPSDQLSCATELFDHLSKDRRARLVFLEGDTSFIDMGLSGAEFGELSSRLERIYNFAYSTDSRLDRTAAQLANFRSVQEVLELSNSCPKLLNLLHCSSAMLSGRRAGIVLEDDFDDDLSFSSHIDASRHQAERVVRRAMSKLPITVVRPSILVGSSSNGEIDRFDGAYTLFLLVLNSSDKAAVPMRDLPMNLVPADFVARAAYHIGLDSRAPGNTYHLVDPSPLNAPRIFELVARAAGKRSPTGYVPSNFARALLRAPGLDRVVKSPRAYFDFLATPVRYDSRKAELLLAGSGIVCPPFESYVDRLVAYVASRPIDPGPDPRNLNETEDSLS